MIAHRFILFKLFYSYQKKNTSGSGGFEWLRVRSDSLKLFVRRLGRVQIPAEPTHNNLRTYVGFLALR